MQNSGSVFHAKPLSFAQRRKEVSIGGYTLRLCKLSAFARNVGNGLREIL
jgi:hypothetical protein